MNYKVIYGKNDLVYTGFLALPGKLYQKDELTQDYDTEYKLLHEKHTLSKYFNITPFVVIDKNSQMPVARCMLTYYPEDDVAYFGFFECIGLIIPELSEPPVRTLGATIPENESHIFR